MWAEAQERARCLCAVVSCQCQSSLNPILARLMRSTFVAPVSRHYTTTQLTELLYTTEYPVYHSLQSIPAVLLLLE